MSTYLGKKCKTCGEEKELALFPKDSNCSDGRRGCCNKCQAAKRRARPGWREKNRARDRRWRYGLDDEAFKDLLESQGGVCAICTATLEPGKSSMHVDHCHETGQVRGLLCGTCNVGLGLFTEDVEKLLNAVSYLRQSKGLSFKFI